MIYTHDYERGCVFKEDFPRAKCSKTKKAWYVPDTNSYRKYLHIKEKSVGYFFEQNS
jgi:hypothetical protein